MTQNKRYIKFHIRYLRKNVEMSSCVLLKDDNIVIVKIPRGTRSVNDSSSHVHNVSVLYRKRFPSTTIMV